VCIFHTVEEVRQDNRACIASYKSQTEVSQTSQSRAGLKPGQNFSKGPFMWQLYAEESVLLAFTCYTFSSENGTWDSTPFMHSWKYYLESRTLLKLPAWSSGEEEGLIKMSGAARTV